MANSKSKLSIQCDKYCNHAPGIYCLRKDNKVDKIITDLPASEVIPQITANLDLASKLDNSVIDKPNRFKNKNSTPKIGELCGMNLLLDLSGAPEDAKYDLYFKARTVLEAIKDRLEK